MQSDGDVAYLAGASYKMGRWRMENSATYNDVLIGGMPEVGKEQIEKFSK